MQRRSKSYLYELEYIVNAMKNMDRFDIIFCKKTRKFNSGELKYY